MKVAINKFTLAFLTPIFLWLAWEPIGIAWLMFIALIPLLFFYFDTHWRGFKLFISLYSLFFVFNTLVTWWVYNSTAWGAITMLVLNSLFMCLPFLFAKKVDAWFGKTAGLIALVVFWLGFEHMHLRWDLSWPWLNLGNAFAAIPSFIQWYEITGVAGGTLLIWIINVLFYFAFITQNKRKAYIAFAVVCVLYLFSFVLGIYRAKEMDNNKPIQALVIQPNYDPWTEKFNLDPLFMLNEMTEMSKKALTDSTEVLLWPETSLVDNIDVRNPAQDYQIKKLKQLCEQYPKLSVYTGADGLKIYTQTPKKPELAARPYGDDGKTWLVFYNASYLVNRDSTSDYFKSKLVPGTEILPFTQYLPFLEHLAVGLDNNSATGTLGTTPNQLPLSTYNAKFVPAICYESIYGDHIRKFVKNGAQFISIITNDAWWGNSPGYKQHFSFARLRAIETRKWVARSANTGISGFINPVGQVVSQTQYNAKTTLSEVIYANNTQTIYTYLGDFIGLLASVFSLVLVPIGIVLKKANLLSSWQ